MKYITIITNLTKDPDLAKTNEIRDFLTRRGMICNISALKQPDGTGMDECAHPHEVPPETDLCVVLGGDGTMLQAARDVFDRDIPLLGVNLGTLGYLTEVNKDAFADGLIKVLAGDYSIEERMMVQAEIDGDHKDHALNDIVISRWESLQVIGLNIYINGLYLNHYKADGMIVSTPTGSTAYNMSAGGPIIEPNAQMLVMTPICPHTLTTRSIVFSPEDEIMLEISKGKGGGPQKVSISFDGLATSVVTSGTRILVQRAKQTTKIVRLSRVSFLEVLQKKLG